MVDSVYKIFQIGEWDNFQETEVFRGSVHDLCDGFIHLCAAHQLHDTLVKHYKDVQKIVLAKFDTGLLEGVKWEISRGGERFPHVYGILEMTALTKHMVLTQSRTGAFNLPDNLMETR